MKTITAAAGGKTVGCTVTVNPDIYIIGEMRTEYNLIHQTVWTNGEPTKLTDGSYGQAYAVYVG